MTQLVSDKQVKIAQDGDLDPLIKLLRHEDDHVRTLAAKTISNLYISEDQDVMLREKNGFAPLVELVKLKDDEVRSKAVWSIAILASNDSNQQEIIRQVGWDTVMDLIKDDVVEVQCGGVTLLGNLALLDENKQQIIEKQGVIVLMDLMRETRDIIVKRAIVTALSNIVDSDNAKETLDDTNLDLLISLLEKSEDERLLSGVVHTISNVANSEDTKFNKTIVRKSLVRLVSLLESPSDVIQKGAVMALNGLSSADNHQNEIIRQGAIKKMANLLKTTTDNELILGIVLCLNNMAQKESNQEYLAELGVTDLLAKITKDTDDPNIKSECTEALKAIGEGTLRQRTERRKKAGIKENVAKIIQVLISDPGTQDKMREAGVVPHLIYLLDPEQQDDKLKGLALDALTLLAINNLQNQNSIAMSVEGKGLIYLEKIIQNKMEKPRIIMRAVRLIGALCWKNKMIQGLVSERNVVPPLVEMLDTFDNNLKKAVLACIACVAEDNAKNKDYVHKLQGDTLIADIIMKETRPDTMVAAAAQAVASLSREKVEIQNVFKHAVGSLVRLLEMVVRIPHGMEDHISQEQLTAALLEVARKNKTNQSIMWKQQVKKPLVEILLNAGASSVSHFNSLALFWEFSRSDKKKKKLAKDPDVLRAIRSLTASRNSGLRDAAVELKERLKI